MKTLAILMMLFLTAAYSGAQEENLVGTWKIVGFAYTTSNGTDRIMEDQIKSANTVEDVMILPDGKLKQISNTSGSNNLDTYEGTWKAADNKLYLTININDHPMNIEWKYKLTDNTLVLSRSNPSGSLTIENTFRKKDDQLSLQP